MGNNQRILVSIARMLQQRYTLEHNVTVLAVISNHLRDKFMLRKTLRKIESRKVCSFFTSEKIFIPHMVHVGQPDDVWEINIARLKEFLDAHPDTTFKKNMIEEADYHG